MHRFDPVQDLHTLNVETRSVISFAKFQPLRSLFIIFLLCPAQARQIHSMALRRLDLASRMMSSIPSSCFCSHNLHRIQQQAIHALSPRNVATSAQLNGDSVISTPSKSFYQRIGSPKHILAPMVAQSDLAFRLMCEQLYNVDLSYTQMIHAYNFVESNGETFRNNHLDVYSHSLVRGVLLGEVDRQEVIVTQSQVNALKGLSERDIDASRKQILALLHQSGRNIFMPMKPTIVQIAAHDPDIAVEAAHLILEKSGCSNANEDESPVAAIDLNLGCPQAIARKGKYGAFLHDEYPKLAYNVLQRLRSELPRQIGVTAKIRLPPTLADAETGRLGSQAVMPPSADDRIRRLIDCGVDLITVHGRTRFENKVAVGAADWKAIGRCIATARAHSGDEAYPIFANGGIETFDDVKNCFRHTGACGVMSSESLLENPGLFKGLDEMEGSHISTAKFLFERQLSYAETYLHYATVFPPLPGSLGAKGGCFNVIRSHLFKFLHRYLEENPDLRSLLGDQAFNNIRQARALVSEIRNRYESMNEEELMLKSSASINSSWYRRHRNPNISATNSFVSYIKEQTLSSEEKKQLVKERIQKLREQRINKEGKFKITL
ncbi:hypothetical protein HJC23_008503 [Cyclotella cryptica]|uniref:tRNA-dihydrouridine(16/17) synthase [NAD(P)(+)] n=1 Tax=Cyclotella cryptica TaxID=29204 RepID=A0ABD3QWU4_9STRA|eukprot:CCRYP_001256-RA/>CCRYP_001256-RA protein AED:0.02 eAED:0.02 QI:274/1/1/1/0.33/0.25/4/1442/605